MSETFLTPEEIAELTGIRTGRRGKTREQLQAEWLRTTGLPFWVNARGRPTVPRSAIEGKQANVEPPRKKWQPQALNPDGSLKPNPDGSLKEG
ncbi:DUF4224 domain-containing protein [Paraburkholderia sp. FT54]|uniref:DUF4224 domain-containing protein n=1 Tax=Paraburkholderia sp. FT54 TaxID=3074437 RepID=UPI00287740D7|nr:DUF4224 domain-containing protein [Paraburkholderia sp. FT54]WNC88827.1 DUF4224 domain-containing protein [Paraburkholderia sp. FT54]